jgi:hypothetical protein
MLSEKTSAHQTPEETQTFEKVLHELRTIFLAAKKESEKQSTTAPTEGE